MIGAAARRRRRAAKGRLFFRGGRGMSVDLRERLTQAVSEHIFTIVVNASSPLPPAPVHLLLAVLYALSSSHQHHALIEGGSPIRKESHRPMPHALATIRVELL